jgi:lipopolysaccharide transport system permease protein
MTPIIYPASAIPENFRNLVFWLNPIATISEVYRDIVLVGEIKHGWEWSVAAAISALIFCCGLIVYQRLRSAFADVL